MNRETGMPKPRSGVPRYLPWDGLALFRQGFRPFFLAAGVGAVALLAGWLLVLWGRVALHGTFEDTQWHAHEMIFGMLAAAVAGFLLTAIPNWTGRMPLQGWRLIGLFMLWLGGRAVMAAGASLGPIATAAIDVSFLIVLLGVVVREILAGRNWRNLPVAVAVGLLATANAISHLEAMDLIGSYQLGVRLGIAVIACLIALIGGRIIPSFTNNWLAKRGVAQRPVPFGMFDGAVLVTTVTALASWTAVPDHRLSGGLLLLAGLANFARVARWQGGRTLSEPLVWILHLAYVWLPAGLALMGLARVVDWVPASAGLHALTAGAMGGMILAVMTRASLGHTGRELTADRTTTTIYLAWLVAVSARVAAPMAIDAYEPLLMLAGVAWCLAFGAFSVRYGAIFLRR